MYEAFQKYLDNKIELSAAQSARVKSLGYLRRLRKKQYILQAGDIWDLHAFVLKGCLRVYALDEKGQERVISFAVENWWAGDKESLLLQQPSVYYIDAIEESELLLFTNANFELICKEIPAFKEMANALLQKSFAVAQGRIRAAISYSAEEKYRDFVHKYPGFATRIPQSMIASYLGITPETLSRVRSLSAKRLDN